MATEEIIKTGKRIYELEEVYQINKDTLLPISDKNLARKITAQNLFKLINGDNVDPSNETYYSTITIDIKFGNILETIKEIQNSINGTDNKYTALELKIDNVYNSLNTKIDSVHKELNDRIDQEVSNINNRITQVEDNFNTKITQVEDNFNTKITQVEDNLNKKITDLEAKVKKLIDNMYTYGTTIPTTLANGKLYFQYF